MRFYRVPVHKLVVTPEAADPAFRPLHDQATLDKVRRHFSLPEQFVLAVGARRPHKNFPLLVRAAASVKDVSVVFVGEADERFADETYHIARDLNANVRFLGKVSEEDLPVLYNLAAAVACPSLVEGFGLPVLEAMACATPVICSDIPVFREVAGHAAMLVGPRDAAAWAAGLERLLQDHALQESLSRAGQERAALFSWRRAAEAVLPVYSRLGLETS
jgi:glycosyltransferase involved in cell wall biosynthesis